MAHNWPIINSARFRAQKTSLDYKLEHGKVGMAREERRSRGSDLSCAVWYFFFYMMSTRMNFDDQRELRTAKFRAQKAHDAEAHCWAEVKKKMSSLFVDLLDNACEAHTFHSLLYEH